MRTRDHYLDNARAQIAAARALCLRDEVEAVHFLGPALLLVGFGIEVFMKAVLVDAGRTDADLKKLGHNLSSMWVSAELREQRDQAGLLAQSCHQDLVESYVRPQDRAPTDPDFRPNLHRVVPSADDFEGHLSHLSDLHSSKSDFALRYPIELETVPDPMLMICVFERLIENYRNGRTIVEAQ